MFLNFSQRESIGELHFTGDAPSDQGVPAMERLDDPEVKAALIVIDENAVAFGDSRESTAVLDILERATIPVAAAICADCSESTLQLAFTAHFRFITEGSRLHFPSVTTATPLGMRLRQTGISEETLTAVVSGKTLDGSAAAAAGLVDGVAGSEICIGYARDFLEGLVKNRSADCIRSAMQSIRNAGLLPVDDALREEYRLFTRCVGLSVEKEPEKADR